MTVPPEIEAEPVRLALRPQHRRHRFPGRTRAVNVLFDDAEFTAVRDAAALAGLTPTGYVAQVAVAAANPETSPATSRAGHELDRAVLAELMSLRTALRRYANNLNQAVTAMHAGGGAPVWLRHAVTACHQAVTHVDDLSQRLVRRMR